MKRTIFKCKGLILLFALLALSAQNASALYDSSAAEQEEKQESYGYPEKINIFNYSEKTVAPKAVGDGFDPLPGDIPSNIPVADGVVWIGLLALGLELRRRTKKRRKESFKSE